VYRVHFEVI